MAIRFSRKRNRRRGVVLLIVLSLLVLFVLVAVSFAIVAGQYKRSAKAHGKVELTGDPPRTLLDRTLMQLLRGTTSKSAMMGHEILGDLYGYDSRGGGTLGQEGVRGTITAATLDANGQFIRFTFSAPYAINSFRDFDDYYNGNVFTILTGKAKNLSTRIVDYDYVTATTSTITVENFETGNLVLANEIAASPATVFVNTTTPVEFLINGRAFNGTGAGYSATTGNLDEVGYGGYPLALLPNYSAYPASTTNMAAKANFGGADESWDAVDYQNMFLAMVPPVPTSTSDIIPSFHRPSLLNYWKAQQPTFTTDVNFMRTVMLRPLGNELVRAGIPIAQVDHPNFTGSNPNYDPSGTAAGALWDVDNDGDGIPDSIWIDIGLPTQTSPDGRRYKPLAAILVKDLDGSLNLNAHGNLAQLDAAYSSGLSGNYAGLTSYIPPRGFGYGPAEINFTEFFGATNTLKILQSRYGGAGAMPGINGTNDVLSAIKTIHAPASYTVAASSYGSPDDLWGRGAVAVDYLGHPLPHNMGLAGATVDDPYEVDMSRQSPGPTASDNLFTYGELERLLRSQDVDWNTLPERRLDSSTTLAQAVAAVGSDMHRSVTVESRHIPVPNINLPIEMRNKLAQLNMPVPAARHVINLLYWKIWLNIKAGADGLVGTGDDVADGTCNTTTNNLIASQANFVLPFEVLRGGMFDINRWFGNGYDEGNDPAAVGPVIDDPDEARLGENVWGSGYPASFTGVPFHHRNGDPSAVVENTNANNPQTMAHKQIYARHLYCLMMLLTDGGYNHPTSEALTAPEKKELTSRRIAQWAINVVDFRDADGIMTPFEYDADPFNTDGWNSTIDGNPITVESATDRRIVWGCEYPDVILTETAAFHDRRVKDTQYDDAGGGANGNTRIDKTDPTKVGDNDPDQFRIPQGSLFLELYCTRGRAANNPQYPRELYSYDSVEGIWKLDLGRLGPVDANGLRYPVWRAVISERPANPTNSPLQRAQLKPDSTSFEPRDMSLLQTSLEPLNEERIIWFAARDTLGFPPGERVKTYYNRSATNPWLAPGRYAVVGPRPVTHIGSKTTVGTNSGHSISLAGSTVTATDNNAGTSFTYPASGSTIQPPLGIWVAAVPPTHPTWGWTNSTKTAPNGIGLSVSEPLPQSTFYYKEPNPTNPDDGRIPTDAYANLASPGADRFPDEPLDNSPSRPLGKDNLLSTGTTLDYKAVFLQRLANPLDGYDFNANPYITVDWATIDLTVYNGEDRVPLNWDETMPSNPAPIGKFDPNDPNPEPANGSGIMRFRSRERGFAANESYWSPTADHPDETATSGAGDNNFRYELRHTLGYINSTLTGSRTGGRTTPAYYIGDPLTRPFPWIEWFNRPFNSPTELLMVPTSSPARLLHEFSTGDNFTGVNPYNSQSAVQNFRAPNPHLLNFFQTANPTAAPSGVTPAAHFYRLFDVVETPSPFVGAERWYNPTHFKTTTSPSATVSVFRPPFNQFSRFRDPGRVNINTIFDSRVWRAITAGYPEMSTNAFWAKVAESREGIPSSAAATDYPTSIANPFRAGYSADLMPNVADMRRQGAEATLLRSDPNNSASPLFESTSNAQFNDTNRNASFRYRGLSRLSNLLTTHSNVFAIWITIGYFEVEPNENSSGTVVVDDVHPDGFRLAGEMGADFGQVRRHRAFYIVDRSIPVAYEPDQDYNVENTVRLRRYIE